MKLERKKQKRMKRRLTFVAVTSLIGLVSPIVIQTSTIAHAVTQAEKQTDAELTYTYQVNEKTIDWTVKLAKPSHLQEERLMWRFHPASEKVNELTVKSDNNVIKSSADETDWYALGESSGEYQVQFTTSITAEPLVVDIGAVQAAESVADPMIILSEQELIAEVGDSEKPTDVPTESEAPSESVEMPTKESTEVSEPELPQFENRAIPQGPIKGSVEVPPGGVLLDDLFVKAESSFKDEDDKEIIGSGKVSIDTEKYANGRPYSKISLGGSYKKLGVWSKQKINLEDEKTESRVNRFYFKFPEEKAGDLTTKTDGIGLVFHNDTRSSNLEKVISTANQGQSLGALGATGGYDGFIGYTMPNDSAIKDSLVIEIDTNVNSDYEYKPGSHGGEPDAGGFDLKLNGSNTVEEIAKGPHLAYSMPNQKSSYRPVNNQGKLNTFFTIDSWSQGIASGVTGILKHHNLESLYSTNVTSNIQDGTWYEFNFWFDEENLNYQVVNPDTKKGTEPATIPLTTLTTAVGGDNFYWGLTSANGKNEGTTEFIFTDIPVDYQGSIESDILKDEKSIASIPKPNEDKVIKPEDKLKFQSIYLHKAGDGGDRKKGFHYSNILDKDVINWPNEVKVSAKKKDGTELATKTGSVNKITGEITAEFSELYSDVGDEIIFEVELSIEEDLTQKGYEIFSSEMKTEIKVSGGSQSLISVSTYWLDPNVAPTLKFSDDNPNIQVILREDSFGLEKADRNSGDQVGVFFVKKGGDHSKAEELLSQGGTSYRFPEDTEAGDYELFARDLRGAESKVLNLTVRVDHPTQLAWDSALNNKELDLGTHDKAENIAQNFYWKDEDKEDEIGFVLKNGDKEVQIIKPSNHKPENVVSQSLIEIPSSELAYGENIFILSATKNGKILTDTSPITLTVNVVGSLKLRSVTEELSWTGRTVDKTEGLMSRDDKNNLSIEVQDSRENTSDWTVSASVNGLGKVPFTLAWKDKNANEEKDMSDGITLEKTKFQKNGYQHTASYSNEVGVLLHNNKPLPVGDYSGNVTITWNLIDAKKGT